MAQDEFAIIQDYFRGIGKPSVNTCLGIGDDAAVVDLPPGRQQVVCMDTLISGVHFPVDTAAADIAHKALAVNLSDLAAMAATPDWFQLSLSLPTADRVWLKQFAEGLDDTAQEFSVQLIGGDTCRGPLSITVQIAGQVVADEYVGRSGASAGDLVLVSGQLGNAGLGLAHLSGRLVLPDSLVAPCLTALNRPRPRLDLVDFLRRYASAAIDISDGLQADLGHVLTASGCGARIDRASLPVNCWVEDQGLYDYALAAGDDYEICCTVPSRCRDEIELWNRQQPAAGWSIIGEIVESGYALQVDDRWQQLDNGGYRHFS